MHLQRTLSLDEIRDWTTKYYENERSSFPEHKITVEILPETDNTGNVQFRITKSLNL